MNTFDELFTRAYQAWLQDPIRISSYITQCASCDCNMRSRFEVSHNPIEENSPECGLCGTKMRLVADLELDDAPELDIRGVQSLLIHACYNTSCKKDMLSGIGSKWATYHWRSKLMEEQHYRANEQQWISVQANSMFAMKRLDQSNIELPMHGITKDKDIIDPFDFGWYSNDGFNSHAQEVLKKITDRDMRASVYDKLIEMFPRWHDAKFGGYPHWRSLQMDAGCECSMRGTLLFTFTHDLCPTLCPEGVSAWLFLCKHKPLVHSISLIFQRNPSDKRFENGLIDPPLLPL